MRLGSRVWLLRSHPNYAIYFVGMIVAMLLTGVLSITADTDALTAPVLRFYYDLFGIHTWGWLFLTAATIMVVGLPRPTFTVARLGMASTFVLLTIRLGLQIQAGVDTYIADGWAKTAPQVAGLPLLLGLAVGALAMTRMPINSDIPTTMREPE